jgi:YaiO family outer membrane protein
MPRLLILLACMVGLNQGQNVSTQEIGDLQRQARAAVSEKRFADALPFYRTLLAASPEDVDYILWVARLSAWTGDHPGAADFYSRALALDPNNVDAMVGKANVLMWQRSYPDVLALLTRAGELEPSDPDVELAWSRYYHWQGDDANAKLHLEKCLAYDGNNQEARQLEDALVPDHTIELRVSYELDTLPGTEPGGIAEIGVTYFNRKGEIGFDFAHLARFGEAGRRGGLHFSRRLGSLTSVRGAALFGGGGDIVARQDLSLGMSRTVRHGFVLGTDFRHIAFRTLKVDAAIADLDYYFEKPIWFATSFGANRVEGATTPALLMRFYARVRTNLTLNTGYGHGTEIFQLALPTDFGAFRRDSYIGGLTLAVTRKTRAETTYTLARRSTGTFENTILIAMVHTL